MRSITKYKDPLVPMRALMDMLSYVIQRHTPLRLLISNIPPTHNKPTPPKPFNYIIPTPISPKMPQNMKIRPKVNGAPCIRHPKIAERPYQPPFLKNLKTSKSTKFTGLRDVIPHTQNLTHQPDIAMHNTTSHKQPHILLST